MKKSVLKKLISEVVRRKLNETDGKRVADVVNNIISNNAIDNIQVLTHYGSEKLEIMEVYENNGVLYLTVQANPVNEISTTISTQSQDQSSQQNISTNKTTDDTTKVDPKVQADIDSTQKDLDKVTASIRKIDGAKTKLEDPVRRKIQDLDRRRATLQKSQGNLTNKLEKLRSQ